MFRNYEAGVTDIGVLQDAFWKQWKMDSEVPRR
jgi:hypothetical protein